MYKQAYLSNLFQMVFPDEVKLGILLKFDYFAELIESEPFDLLLFSANRSYSNTATEKYGLYELELKPHAENEQGLTFFRDGQNQFNFYHQGERIPVLSQDEWFRQLHSKIFPIMCTRFSLSDRRNM